MGMKIVITGASGFVGFNLYRHLKSSTDHDIIGTFNSNQKEGMVHCDCMDINDIIKVTHEADIVFMLATKTFGVGIMATRPELMVRENIIMNANTIEACRINGVSRVIYLSSSTVYQESYKPLEESNLDLNIDPYHTYMGVAWVKRYTEKLCQFYSGLGLSIGIIRPTYIYGPYDKIGVGSHFLPAIVKRAIEENNCLTVWGNGYAKKNCIYIDDMVLALEKIMSHKNSDIFNFCSSEVYSIRQIVERILNICGKKIDVFYDESKPEAIPYRHLIRNKFDSTFGPIKETPIEDGLKNTINWIGKQIC